MSRPRICGLGVCSVEGCGKPDLAPKGLCREHYRRFLTYGTFEKLRRPKGKATCSVEGCDSRDDGAMGLCRTHYMRRRHHGHTGLVREGGKRSHPLYSLWFERKSSGCLSPEWLDFKQFVADISPVPEGHYFLVRLDGAKPFGPANFKWQEHLKRRPGEARKEWWARKWAARQVANPGMERNRTTLRRYGLTTEDYEAIRLAQADRCAICGERETTVDPKTGTVKRLAIDHCHTTLKARELLCFRCNTVIGRVNEDARLLLNMIEYLKRHAAS